MPPHRLMCPTLFCKNKIMDNSNSTGRFVGKTAIVTGSSGGMGREIALGLAREGANVVFHGQSEEKLKEAEQALKESKIPEKNYLIIKGSIQEETTQDRLVNGAIEKFGHLDILINNAGISHLTGSDSNSVESMDYIYSVNLRSIYTLTNKALPHLIKTKGNIINISSVGSQRLAEAFVPYGILKAALDHLTRGLALANAKHGIRVNTVSPGGIRTDFLTRHGMAKETATQMEDFWASTMIPMKRFGSTKELAGMVLFLASDEASYITGTNMVVDGGVLAGIPSDMWMKKE